MGGGAREGRSACGRKVAGVALADRVEASAAFPDDVVEEGDAQEVAGVGQASGHLEVLGARRDVAAGVGVPD